MFFPGYVRPLLKNFLTQEDQRILDKFMGRPEKPPSSAYSLVRLSFLYTAGAGIPNAFGIPMVALCSVFQRCSVSNKMAAVLSKTIGNQKKGCHFV